MKKNLKLFDSAIALCFAVIACEKNDRSLMPGFDDFKNANNGMIKSYDNAVVLTWNEQIARSMNS